MRPPRDAPPANYRLLPDGPRVAAEDERQRSHELLRDDRLSGHLYLRVVTVDPVHVGSGAPARVELYDTDSAEIARGMVVRKDAAGRPVPVFPGASLKGAARSLCEALGGGCRLAERVCQPRCVTCGLFGHADNGGAYAARVGFDDAVPEDADEALDCCGAARLPVAYQPRLEKGRRIYGRPAGRPRAEVPYEVVAQGVVFGTRLTLRNLTRPELGLVCLALGLDGTFLPRIGGGKFAGLGRVRYEVAGGLLREGYREPRPRRLEQEAAGELVATAIRDFEPAAAGRTALQVIRETLGVPR